MKVLLVFVITADGKITKWGDPNVKSWSSHEDQDYFKSLIRSSTLVVVGSNTYRADPMKPKDDRMMIVMTRKPEQFREIEVQGKLEFTSETPTQLVKKYRERNYGQMLVAGGPQIATSFLKENLVDEIWLTIEPLVFGSGGNFVTDSQLEIKMQLLSVERINQQGTLIVKYGINRS